MTYESKRPSRDSDKRRPEKPAPKRTEAVNFKSKKPFNRKKFLLQLVTVAAVALAIAVGLSIFFRVDTISVSGLNKYYYDTVVEESGIQSGDSLLFFSRAEVSSKIMQALPHVKSVRVSITLPGTVNIIIEEVAVAYAIVDTQDQWWLMSAEGKVLEMTDSATAATHTTISGVRLQNPVVGETAKAEETGASTAVTGADRLAAALAITQTMEMNELLGQFAVVDVTNVYDLCLWYGEDYQFKLGDQTQLNVKMAYIKAYLPRILADFPPGILDVSNPDNSNGSPFKEFD